MARTQITFWARKGRKKKVRSAPARPASRAQSRLQIRCRLASCTQARRQAPRKFRLLGASQSQGRRSRPRFFLRKLLQGMPASALVARQSCSRRIGRSGSLEERPKSAARNRFADCLQARLVRCPASPRPAMRLAGRRRGIPSSALRARGTTPAKALQNATSFLISPVRFSFVP